MPYEKFDVSKLERLNDPARFEYLDPDVIWSAAGMPDARSVVEIGAGTGMFACKWAERASGAEIYAVDVEPAMVRWMYEHRPAALAGRLHPVLSRETVVPLPTGAADVVITVNLHHELADPVSTYREALRLLRIGGRIVVSDWAPGGTEGGPRQDVRVPAADIAEMLARVGFSDVETSDALPRHSLVTGTKPNICAL